MGGSLSSGSPHFMPNQQRLMVNTAIPSFIWQVVVAQRVSIVVKWAIDKLSVKRMVSVICFADYENDQYEHYENTLVYDDELEYDKELVTGDLG